MRIALFSDAFHPRVSGLVTAVEEIRRGMKRRGHEVRIFCPKYPARSGAVPFDPEVLRIASAPTLISEEDRLALFWGVPRAWQAISDFDPDVIHVQTEFSVGALGRRFSRWRGQPVLSTCHTHYEMYARSYLGFAFERAGQAVARVWMGALFSHDDRVIVPSRQIEAVLRSYGVEKAFDLVPTGVDRSLFHPRPEEAQRLRASIAADWPELGEGPVVFFAGRLGIEKNVFLVLEAFERVLAAHPDARLLVAGGGPAEAELRERIAAAGLAGKARLLGYVKRAELPAYYSLAKVFLFPSASETQGLVTVESLLCGTPVVGVDAMGSAEILAGDVGGILCPPRAEALAEAVLRLLSDPELYARKAAEAEERGMLYSAEVCLDKLERIYAETAAVWRPGGRAIS